MIDRTVSRADVQRITNRLGNVFFCGSHGFERPETFCKLGSDTGGERATRTVRMRRRKAAVDKFKHVIRRKQPVCAVFAAAVAQMPAFNHHVFHAAILQDFGGAFRILTVFNINTRQCLRFRQIGV